jgi:hypothetical protein
MTTMETAHFDQLVANVGQARTRRSAVRFLGAALLGTSGLGLLGLSHSDARRRRKKKGKHGKGMGKNTDRCLTAGAFCEQDEQCCTEKTGRICEVAANASNSDTTCCGGIGAPCGGVNDDLDALAPFCCAGFVCSTDEDPSGTPGVCLRVVHI